MNRDEILESIANGENSLVEFKRDDVRPVRLASEIAALLNHEGGRVLLGVDDDGSISGLSREPSQAEEWVMQVARDNLQPPVIPTWEVVELAPDVHVGIVSLPPSAPDKPYKVRHGSSWVTKVRVGSTTRDASREEEQRLYQRSGGLRYGIKPVLGTSETDLDKRRLLDYFRRVRGDGAIPSPETPEWSRLLCNLELAVEIGDVTYATVDGILLFGPEAGRYVPQSGIRALCYLGSVPDYAARADEHLRGPLLPLGGANDIIYETGIVDRAWDFVRRNTVITAHLDGPRRVERWDYPEVAVRELVVNAVAHRDYSITGTDVELTIFDDRLEVRSPGRLPNSVTTEAVKSGVRFARNQTLVNFMRDYRYVDARGMGILHKVLPAMNAHNGTEPDFIADEHSFTVRLWK